MTVDEAIAEVEHIRITEGSEPFRYEVPKP